MRQMASASEGDRIRIVLADDHEVVRSGLRMVLESQEDFEVVEEAADVQGTISAVAEQKPDALVLDINMPGAPTLPQIPAMRSSSPKTAVIVLTMQSEPAFAREALRAGALGYVLKQSAGTELVDAIRTALSGGTYLNPELGARLAAGPPTPADLLTPRELSVLRSLALGRTAAEAGDELGIGRRTVETHRAHIQEKLGLSSRAELTEYAHRNHLLA